LKVKRGKMNIFFERFVELLIAPYTNSEMLWIVIPLLLSMFFVTIYFGRYRYEELGWNSAFSNSLILIFVSINLVHKLYREGILGYLDFKNLLVLAVIFESVALLMISFFHLLPRNVAFNLYQNVPINVVAYAVVVLVYSDIKIDIVTIICTFLLIIILTLVLSLIKRLIPRAVELLPWEIEEYKKAPEP